MNVIVVIVVMDVMNAIIVMVIVLEIAMDVMYVIFVMDVIVALAVIMNATQLVTIVVKTVHTNAQAIVILGKGF